MTSRLRPALAGLAVAVGGWALGSPPLAIAGVGLALAGLLSAVWSVAAGRASVVRSVAATTLVEGQELDVVVVLRRTRGIPGSFRFAERIGTVSAAPIRLRPGRAAVVHVPSLHRGFHPLGPGRLVGDDPLGLARVELCVPSGPVVRVRPLIVELSGTFVEGGREGGGGSRHTVDRQAGSEPVGVREYREGESLRAVHWASSARRSRLMVRELSEPPVDEVVIVLDLESSAVVGPPGASSLDEAVRAAGALVRAHAARRRRVGLVLAAARPVRLSVSALGADWDTALDALTAAQAVDGACTASLLARRDGAGLVLVTARPLEGLAEPLLQRGGAAVVAIDAPTYAGAARSPAAPALLRLAAHGVPVAVVRAGDDLATVLSRPRVRRHG